MSRSRFQFQPVDAAQTRVGIVGASYNPELADALVASTRASLTQRGVQEENVEIVRVPGSFEVPVVASEMARSGDFHAVIALGVVVAGDTSHHELIGQTTAKALLDIAVLARTPVINGILVVDTEEQAHDRITGGQARGPEFAEAALHMAILKHNWTQP